MLPRFATLLIVLFAVAPWVPVTQGAAAVAEPETVQEGSPAFSGMDESVNVDLAGKAGVPARKPYIDVESLGDLWNFILLMGGAICGFVVGRYWDQIWGRAR